MKPCCSRIGLDDLLQRVARLRQRRRQRLDADRAAVVVRGDAGEIAAVERIEAFGVDLELAQRAVGDLGGRSIGASRRRRSRARGAAGGRRCAACRGSGARSRRRRPALMATFSTPAPRVTIVLQLGMRVEVQPHRNAEAVAQRRGQQAGAGGGADERELGEVDPDRARRRPLADDEVELVVLHGRIEDLLHRRIEAVDLVDEQHVAVFEVGQQRGQVAGLGDHRARGGAEADAQLARHDLGQRGLAEARRAGEQHVVERLAARLGRLDEDAQVGARLLLADELGQDLRPERLLHDVSVALGPRNEAIIGHALF